MELRKGGNRFSDRSTSEGVCDTRKQRAAQKGRQKAA